jgi:branched-chain amino acid transport system ATP-binding protein
MLRVQDLEAYYGGHQALKGISLEIQDQEIVCLIGANGAGKTTLLNCLSGVHPQRRGAVFFKDREVTTVSSQGLVRLGIVQVPENRQLFGPLTVEENLEMGAYLRAGKMKKVDLLAEMDNVFRLFPALANRRKQRAGTLSGGEQQMVAIGRGLMADPSLLLLDEPSLGLAPLIVREIFRIIGELRNEGRTILLVEQNALAALKVSQRGYVIENGRISAGGPADLLMEDDKVRRAFLGQDVRI